MRNLFGLHSEMGRIFGDLFASDADETDTEKTSWMPTVDISETENGYEIRAELPGVSEEDVNVSVTDTRSHRQRRETAGSGNGRQRLSPCRKTVWQFPKKFHATEAH